MLSCVSLPYRRALLALLLHPGRCLSDQAEDCAISVFQFRAGPLCPVSWKWELRLPAKNSSVWIQLLHCVTWSRISKPEGEAVLSFLIPRGKRKDSSLVSVR